MTSLDGLAVRAALARGAVLNAATDTPVAMRLRYIGTGSVTSVTVTTATNIVTVSTEGTKTYAFATYTTLQTLRDAINADAIFEAKVLDALLSDASASKLLDGAITSGTDDYGVVTWDVLVDTSTMKALTLCLSNKRNWNTAKLAQAHRVHLQEAVYNVTLGGAGAGNFVVYHRAGKNYGQAETVIFSDTSVSATKEDYTFASGFGKLSSQDDGEIIVRLKDGTSITDAAANYLRVVGVLE